MAVRYPIVINQDACKMGRLFKFSLDDLDENIDLIHTKTKIEKHSKLHAAIEKMLKKPFDLDKQRECFELLDDDDIDTCISLIDNMSVLDEDCIRIYNENIRLFELIRPFILLEKYRKEVILGNGLNDGFGELFGYLDGIKTEEHPLYGIYTLLQEREELSPKHVLGHNDLHAIVKKVPDTANLNWLDVSEIISFDSTFFGLDFNGDISLWHLDNAQSLWAVFMRSKFNGDISKWKFPKAHSLTYLFSNSEFNGDISQWTFPSVTGMCCMFEDAKFNGDISGWDVTKVRYAHYMFSGSEFRGDLSKWSLPNAKDLKGMFANCKIPKVNLPKDVETNELYKDAF